MSALMIINLKVKNLDKLKEYSAQTGPILEKFAGEVLIKGQPSFVHGESNCDFDKTVVFKFPSKKAAENWYNSPAYQKLLEIRDQAMDSVFKIVS